MIERATGCLLIVSAFAGAVCVLLLSLTPFLWIVVGAALLTGIGLTGTGRFDTRPKAAQTAPEPVAVRPVTALKTTEPTETRPARS